MPSAVFTEGAHDIRAGVKSWTSGVYRMLLLSGTASPDGTQTTVADVLALSDVAELNATDYARQTLATAAVTKSGAKTLWDSADVAFGAIGGAQNDNISGALIYSREGGSDNNAVDKPVAYIDLRVGGNPTPTNGSDVTVKPDAVNKWFHVEDNPA